MVGRDTGGGIAPGEPPLEEAPLALRPRSALLRRIAYFSVVLATIVLAAMMLAQILSANGFEIIEFAILALFVLNFVWIAFSFWAAVAGFIIRAARLDPVNLRPIEALASASEGPISSRTAIVIPVYNEDPHRVFAGIEATYDSLRAAGGLDACDFFILSDTTKDDVAAEERRYWRAFCATQNAANRVYYRRREQNTYRKAGNIADFCRQWGLRYDHMIVFDADSIMAGETIVAMIRLMEANPQAGLIQTVPLPVRQVTLFGRALQFSSRLVGPMLASGMSFWHLGESNYYGHNAIIRTRAFIDHCGLPTLPGKAPLGGEIHSHDYVEAALLRRAGWRVYLLPDLERSFEELPGNITDYATRDRRWCQGNLQHLKLLGAHRLHPLNRLHLLQGAFSYLSSPLWVGFLMLSTADVVEEAITGHRYFTGTHQLYPNWPISMLTETVSLFAVTMALLFLPKVMGLVLVLRDQAARAMYGGGLSASVSLAVETVFSMLIAPVLGGLHSYFVASLLVGRGVAWNPQNRSERGLSVGEAVSSVGILFVIGIAWMAVLLWNAPSYVWWVMPVLAGLILSIPVAVISSRPDVGNWLRRQGLLLTPEETAPPPELLDLQTAMDREPLGDTQPGDALDGLEVPPSQFVPMEPQPLDRPDPKMGKALRPDAGAPGALGAETRR
ncbi:MAG: glucans biosynthesis glucosyltransferase MdoH [Rhodospirillales bacterium]|nr:glucans biosynthesis glucosyltransferase MdoH [Rhodospirillales bacterium]